MWPDDLFAATESLLRVLISFRVVRHPLQNNIRSPARVNEGRKRGKKRRQWRWRTRCCGTLFPHGIRRFAQLFSSDHPTNGNPLRRRETKSPPFSRGFWGVERGRRRDHGERAHAKEDPLEARSFRRYRSRPTLTRPLSSARTPYQAGPPSLPSGKRKDRVSLLLAKP